jgi:hypothetical protein
MTRVEPADGEVKSQLKGSAFFYVEVAEKPTEPGGYWTKYPDHCNFDPRWHVENLETAGHMNYHLGFRCCKSIGPRDASARDWRSVDVRTHAPGGGWAGAVRPPAVPRGDSLACNRPDALNTTPPIPSAREKS